ncbi:hypothetical protein ACMC56_09555 [Campylobacterota bacterium DY0563]
MYNNFSANLSTFTKGEMVKEFDIIVFKEDLYRVHGPSRTEFVFI